MALAYIPPGVNVEELTSPSVSPLLATSALVCLVGVAQGYQVGTTQVVFPTGVAPQTITAPPGGAFVAVSGTQSFESVKNLTDPTAGSQTSQGGYKQGTGSYVAGAGPDFSATIAANGATATITPITGGPLATNGGAVQITYRFLPDMYYSATRLDSQALVERRFGPAYDATGVVTPLSAAASIAFQNGAASVVIQPLFKLTDPANPLSPRVQPTTAEAANAAQWQATFAGLRDVEDVNVLVPVFGQSDAGSSTTIVNNILNAAQDHVHYMQTQGQYMVMIGGHDSAEDPAVGTANELRTQSQVMRDRYGGAQAESTVIVSPSRFTRALPTVTNTIITVGGQFMAAAIAGMLASRPTSATLTRKQVAGFATVADARDKGGKDADGNAGLMVIEQKGTAIQVRHAITLSNNTTAQRELSVVRSKHRMIESLRQTIDTQIIGSVPADGNAPFLVKNAVIGVLEALRGTAELVDYQGVQARTLVGDPTTVEVRFSYLPAFPLNFVHIVFSVDLTGATTIDLNTV